MAIFTRSLRLATSIGLVSTVLAGQPAVSGTVSKRLAVLEFKGKIEGDVLDAFADAVRGGAVEGLAGRGVQVMTRENMMVLLKDMGKKECAEGDCEVETARNIGADFVVSGSVVRIDEAFVVTLKLHETKDGSLLATDQIDAKKQLDVLRQLREHGRILVANNVGPRPAPPPVAPPQAPEPTPAVPSAAAASVPPPRPAPQPARGCAVNQVPIPGGTFWMGDPDSDKSKPVHKVTLPPYCIDKTEVTVAAYRGCVQAGGCPPASAKVDWKDIKPEERTKLSEFCTWGNSGMDRHPINCVDWHQATAYCEWTAGRLPTEAEWEYAARGSDGRKYPWGNDEPDKARLNACGGECLSMHQRRGEKYQAMYAGNDGWVATAPVGSYSKGASPFGVLDMAGNVSEWTANTYAGGGSWMNPFPAGVYATFHQKLEPDDRFDWLGFRCAR